MAQQKINDQQPVETIDGAEARITASYSQTGTLTGWIIRDDRKYRCNWTADGTPTTGGEPNNAIRNKAAPVSIDPTKPVTTADGRKVLNLDYDRFGNMIGHIANAPGECTGLVYWDKFGNAVTVGYREDKYRLVNVEEPKPIKTDSPVETVQGCKVHLENFGVSDGSLTGTVVMSNGSLHRMSWDRFGNVTAPGYRPFLWNIRNRQPAKTPDQIEAELLEKFYADLQYSVGEDLAEDYSEALIVGGTAFVRNKASGNQWEVLELDEGAERMLDGDSVRPKDYLPAFLNRDQVAEFFGWYQARQNRAAHEGYERGNAAGRKEAAAYIKRAHTAYLTALNGIGDFFEKDEYIPF